MMALTHAPHNLVVGTSDGIDVRFAGIELGNVPNHVISKAGETSIYVYLSGVRGEATMFRDVHFQQERFEWAERRKAAGSDKSENPPQMPGVLVFDRLTTVVSDDLGTEYTWSGGQVAGDNTEWEAVWFFTPAPPAEARTLRFDFSVDGLPTGKHCALNLAEPTESTR